jgi:putative addiction module killer protein
MDRRPDRQAGKRTDSRSHRGSCGGQSRRCRARGRGGSELRIHHGPGYRVYFTRIGKEVVILLAGGDKGTQAKDIKLAIRLAKNL